MLVGEVVARTAAAGGFSILNVCVDLASGQATLLTGSIQDEPGRPSGAKLLESFVRDNPWLGPRRFGGSGAIPLRRPYARLGAPGLALLGDAGCMTFAAHGSGIAAGLEAARMLADAAGRAADPGHPAVTWAYAARYHREHGGVLLAYDILRRVLQRSSTDEVEALLSTGIVSPASIRASFVQAPPPLGPRELLSTVRAGLRSPRLALRTAFAARNIPASLAHGRRYPPEIDLQGLRDYEARSARLVGDRADPID